MRHERPELHLEDTPGRRRLGERSRRAMVALVAAAAANPVRRVSRTVAHRLVGKYAANILHGLADRELLVDRGESYELTDDGFAVAAEIVRRLEADPVHAVYAPRAGDAA